MNTVLRTAVARRLRAASFGVLAALSVSPALAGGDLVVRDAWVRAVPPVAKNSAGYLVIENHGAAGDVLVGARVAKARVTELHEMVRGADGTLAMRHRREIPLAADATVTLAPGGLHLMLIDLQQPLQAGEKLDGVLRFRDAGEVPVVLEVRTP